MASLAPAADFLAPVLGAVDGSHGDPSAGLRASLATRSVPTVDWLTVEQFHLGAPDFHGDVVRRWSPESGAVVYDIQVPEPVDGSYSSTAQVRSRAGLVSLSFNPSKWHQLHSLDGFTSMREAIDVANGLLSWLGLPEFSPPDPDRAAFSASERKRVWSDLRRSGSIPSEDFAPVLGASGAVLTRVDVCEGFVAGSLEDARLMMAALAQFSSRGKLPRVYRDFETVEWSAQQWHIKYYRKGAELRAYAPKALRSVVEPIAAWADSVGYIRREVRLHAKALRKRGLCDPFSWSDSDMGDVLNFHAHHARVAASRPFLSDVATQLESLGVPSWRAKRAEEVAHAFFNGADVRAGRSRRTFYRLRADLLLVGIDIGATRNVVTFSSPGRSVQLGPVYLPNRFRRKPIVYGDPPEGSPAWRARGSAA